MDEIYHIKELFRCLWRRVRYTGDYINWYVITPIITFFMTQEQLDKYNEKCAMESNKRLEKLMQSMIATSVASMAASAVLTATLSKKNVTDKNE